MSLIEALPRENAVRFAGVVGEMAALIDTRERRLAERNLLRAYGDSLDQTRIRIVARECFVKIAKNAADVIRSRRWDEYELADMVREVEGEEHFDEALRKGRGVIGLTGHVGNFELCAAWFSAVKKAPLSVLGRRLYDDRIDQMVIEHRERWGMENIPTDSPKRIVEALREGRVLGVLMDLDSSRVAGYFVPFFGHPAKTAAGVITIGRRTRSPVVPIALFRRFDDYYKLVILPAFEIPYSENKERDVMEALTECNRALECLINIDPTQWAWIHDRWKSKPAKALKPHGGMEEVGLSSI